MRVIASTSMSVRPLRRARASDVIASACILHRARRAIVSHVTRDWDTLHTRVVGKCKAALAIPSRTFIFLRACYIKLFLLYVVSPRRIKMAGNISELFRKARESSRAVTSDLIKLLPPKSPTAEPKSNAASSSGIPAVPKPPQHPPPKRLRESSASSSEYKEREMAWYEAADYYQTQEATTDEASSDFEDVSRIKPASELATSSKAAPMTPMTPLPKAALPAEYQQWIQNGDWTSQAALEEENRLAKKYRLRWPQRGPPGPKHGGPKEWRGMPYREQAGKWMSRGGKTSKKKKNKTTADDDDVSI